MFFIIGIMEGTASLGTRCCSSLPCCGAGGVYALLTCAYHQLTFFFIPIFKFGKRYFLTCPNCGAVFEVEREQGRRAARDPAYRIDSAKLYRTGQQAALFCPNCGARVSPDTRYCPYCGRDLSNH